MTLLPELDFLQEHVLVQNVERPARATHAGIKLLCGGQVTVIKRIEPIRLSFGEFLKRNPFPEVLVELLEVLVSSDLVQRVKVGVVVVLVLVRERAERVVPVFHVGRDVNDQDRQLRFPAFLISSKCLKNLLGRSVVTELPTLFFFCRLNRWREGNEENALSEQQQNGSPRRKCGRCAMVPTIIV